MTADDNESYLISTRPHKQDTQLRDHHLLPLFDNLTTTTAIIAVAVAAVAAAAAAAATFFTIAIRATALFDGGHLFQVFPNC